MALCSSAGKFGAAAAKCGLKNRLPIAHSRAQAASHLQGGHIWTGIPTDQVTQRVERSSLHNVPTNACRPPDDFPGYQGNTKRIKVAYRTC